MNIPFIFIFVFYMSRIILSNSLQTNEKKLCVNCKFFKKDFFTDPKFGKCALYPKEEENNYYFVTGKLDKRIDYGYCSVSRMFDTYCGKEGKFYQEK